MGENADLTPPQLRQEKIIANEYGGLTIENPGPIWHLTTLKHAIKLEGLGLKHSSGRSALAHAKKLYGFTGNRERVLQQVEERLEQLKEEYIKENF
jgi:hypothetical protein